MKVFSSKEYPQGSNEWLQLRAGIPTASEFSRLVTPKKQQVAKGEKVSAYVSEKVAEKWLGRPLDVFAGSFDMNQGKILEEELLPTFELETGLTGEKVGFVTTDDGGYGCSPDLLLTVGGVEAKNPKPETHVAYLLAGECPDEYYAQVQGSMLVTGSPFWYFASGCRGFPPLILKVMRDEEYLKTLADALDSFCAKVQASYLRLVQMNGGPPKRNLNPVIDHFEEFYADAPDDIQEKTV